MPATTKNIFLNAGSFGPLPSCVLQAMGKIYGDARSSVAHLLNADLDEIALTDNTGEGLNIISNGIKWHEDDEVITTNHEHMSLLAPLYQLRDRYGIVVRFADIGPAAERPVLKAIADLVTPRTRLISISHVTWTTGAVLNISEVAYMGREWGIPVLIDGAQSAGAIPVDVRVFGIDFYAIPMQKWLCGPDGTGALYVRKDALSYVSPTYVGPWSIKHEEGQEWELLESAQRFEVGGRQTAAIAGQAAILKWLEETVGYQWLFERIASLSGYAYKALIEVPGLTILTPRPGESGLVSFKLEGRDDAEIVTYLRDKYNMYIRNIPTTKSLRISTGFYNTEEEIDKLIAALHDM